MLEFLILSFFAIAHAFEATSGASLSSQSHALGTSYGLGTTRVGVSLEPVVVSGATGRTGSLLYSLLRESDIEVRALVR